METVEQDHRIFMHLDSPAVSFDLAGLGRPDPRPGILNGSLIAHVDSLVIVG
jgi:hypothetical protein